jgi:hypothetical protein
MGHKGIKKGKGKSQKQKTTKAAHEIRQKKNLRTTRTLEVKGGLLGSRVS